MSKESQSSKTSVEKTLSADSASSPKASTHGTLQQTDNGWSYLSLLENNVLVYTCVALLVTLFVSWLARIVLNRLEKLLHKSKYVWDVPVVKALRSPLQFFIWLESLLFFPSIFYKNLNFFGVHEVKVGLLNNARMLVLVAALFWFVMNYLSFLEKELLYTKTGKIKNVKAANANIPGLMKIIRVVLVVILVFTVLQTVGFPLGSLLAFGGFGTLAVSFAAKDTLANFFGGLMIFMDKPFDIGDWIRSPDRNIEGTVEYIGWRLTRIRTFDKRPLFVPNSIFSTISVENPTRMHNRRIKKVIGLRYEDAGKVRGILAAVKTMLEEHSDIDQNALTMVNLVEFADSSLNFMVYTFTKTTNWGAYQAIQEDVLLKIIDIITEFGAECAFPSRTLYVPSGEITVKN